MKNWPPSSYNRILEGAKATILSSKVENDRKLFVLSWVDDLVFAGTDAQGIEEFKKLLKESSKWTTEENSSDS